MTRPADASAGVAASVLAGVAEGGPLAQALERLTEMGGRTSEFKGMISITLAKGALVEGLTAAKEAGLVMLTDVVGMDYLTYPGHRGKRFAVIYNIHDITGRERLFVRVELDDGETCPTATGVWRGADFLERETFDMMGVVFEGHPNLRKLLTPEDLEGHPHRKDFPIGESPTLFNDGRFLDPATFRSGLMGQDAGLTGWKGGARDGVRSTQGSIQDGAEGQLPGEGGES